MHRVVLICDAALVDGGSAQVALSSAVELDRRGWDVTIFAALGPIARALSDHPTIHVVCLNQVDILSNPNRGGAALQGLWNENARRACANLLREFQPNDTVVHVHSWTKALSSSPIYVARSLGFPLVATLHEYFSVCPVGSLYNHRTSAICELAPMSLACMRENCDSRSYSHKLWRVARQAVQARIAGLPARIDDYITVSEFSHEVLKSLLPPTARLHPVDYPIDAEPCERAEAERHARFAYVGRLSREKGADLFATAARSLDVPAVFIGDGPDRAAIEGILPNATITGWQDRAGVRRNLRDARALVFPSRWYETFGLVVLEAASLGIPSIVPDRCAAARNVVNGVTGLVFRTGDLDDLEAQIGRLRDDALVNALSVAAYERFWSNPQSLVSHVDQLIEVYGKLRPRDAGAGVLVGAAEARQFG